MKLEPEKKYSVKTKEEEHEGVFVSEKDGFIFIKLKSGYNLGIDKEKIISSKEIPMEKSKSDIPKPKSKKGLKKILILHTGGTVASKVDYSTGAVIAKFTPEEIIALFPELQDIANVDSKLVGNMQSEMMRFDHYNILAEEVANNAQGYEGIIITHGTDTLHYTSAALTFALENLSIPLILVGSQRSSDRPSSDAPSNLIAAAKLIAQTDFAGVAICLHEGTSDNKFSLFPPLKTKKMHTSRRDAFKPVNAKSIATINLENDKIEFHREYQKKSKQEIIVKKFNPKIRIGIVRTHTNMFSEELKAYETFDGLVLEVLGIGHMPTMAPDKYSKENEKILEEIQFLCKKMPVVAAAQTVFGRIDMNVYTPGRQLLDAGVLGNYHDVPTDTAFIKLAWVLSNYDKDDARIIYSQNLRGEISKRTEE